MKEGSRLGQGVPESGEGAPKTPRRSILDPRFAVGVLALTQALGGAALTACGGRTDIGVSTLNPDESTQVDAGEGGSMGVDAGDAGPCGSMGIEGGSMGVDAGPCGSMPT